METDQETMVSSFLEIAVGQTAATAIQFLQAARWRLEEAIQRFYAEHEFDASSSSPFIAPPENDDFMATHKDWEMTEEVEDPGVWATEEEEIRLAQALSMETLKDSGEAVLKDSSALEEVPRALAEEEEIRLAQALSMETLKDSGEAVLKDSSALEEVPRKEKYNYPPLPEEPKGDKKLLCRVGVRLPDGRKLQRNFFNSDPIQLLWSFCAVNCGDKKPLRLTHAIPGAVKDMKYESTLTFEESGVANSMISVTWKEH